MLTSWVWMRNDAWPIQVTQIWPSRIFGNCGAAGPPERLVKSEGIKTLVKKLRLCQSARGRSRTRVESRSRGRGAPSRDVWRTTFRRLFLGKRSGTLVDDIGAISASKTLKGRRKLSEKEMTKSGITNAD